jgi:hypothetical protein
LSGDHNLFVLSDSADPACLLC